MRNLRATSALLTCCLAAAACDDPLTAPTPLNIDTPPVVAPSRWPAPVDLGIQNIPQETSVWCWAAVSQQIIARLRGPLGTPPQCTLVALAYNTPPEYCCTAPQACAWTGALEQIQWLIGYFGGRYSAISPPADPMTVYNTLASGRPIIMAVRASGLVGHVVVIRGMEWIPSPFGADPVLYVNDPLSYFTQPVPFANISRFWQQAIVVL